MKPDLTLDDAVRRWQALREQGRTVAVVDLCVDCPEKTAARRERLQVVASMAAFLGFVPEDEAPVAHLGTLDGDRTTQGPNEDPATARDSTGAGQVTGVVGSRFQVLRLLSRGGLGNVYVAYDRELGREVALKEIQPRFADDPVSRSRFEREAEVTGRLEHPGVVPVHSLGYDAAGRPYYVMQLIRGKTLGDAIAEYHQHSTGEGEERGDRSLALRQLLRRFMDVCNVIEYAHSVGMMHRDIKPNNIMLGPYGETLVVDWGLAGAVGREDPDVRNEGSEPIPSATNDGLTLPGSTLGTPAFMSPEQAEGGAIGPASDVYGLGATLYFLLTGQPAFQDRERQPVLERVRASDFQPPRRVKPDCPRGLEAICLKAMARNPTTRYASARSLADDVERWLADEPVTALHDSIPTHLTRWARRHRTLMASAAMLLGTAVVALLVSTILIGREQTQTNKALQALMAAQKDRALGRIDALLKASAQALPTIIEEFAPSQDWINPRLRELLQQDLPPELRRRVRLALLPFDPDQAEPLGRDLLDCRTDEFTVITENLRPYRERLSSTFWSAMHDPSQSPQRRFRAGMALARFEPEGARWTNADDEFLATQLLNSNPDDQRDLRGCLNLIAGRLVPILRKQFSDANVRESVRESAAQALADYAREDPDLIADLVSRSSASQYQLLFPVLRDQITIRTEAIFLLGSIAGKAPTGELTESERLAEGRRRARAAIALVQLGEPRAALSAFGGPSDPEASTQFIHESRERGLKPVDLVAVLNIASNVRERFTLLLALGEFQPAEFPDSERSHLKTRLLKWYASDPSHAIHGASGWLLRTWGLSQEVAAVDRTTIPYASSGGRLWFVDAVGDDLQTFVVCPPGNFLIGSSVSETDRDNDETIHSVTLNRSFAIGEHEVTRAQFDRYRRATGKQSKRLDGDPRSPAVGVSWYEAVSYCRWLTRQSGLVESDQCYEDPAAQEKGPEGLPKNWPFHPERRGFRLPTEAEWEYACRAGTVTPFSFGSDRQLLSYYGWFQENAGRNPRAWGELRPNLFGLFDLHGNAIEWCHDCYEGYDSSPQIDPIGAPNSKYRVYRGGAWTGGARLCRSADRDLGVPTDRAFLGFRLARTLPAG